MMKFLWVLLLIGVVQLIYLFSFPHNPIKETWAVYDYHILINGEELTVDYHVEAQEDTSWSHLTTYKEFLYWTDGENKWKYVDGKRFSMA